MKIIWHGHSCFSVEAEGYTVVFDPYADGSVPGYAPLRLGADAVYCSHGHADHSAAELVTLSSRGCPLSVDTIASFHDPVRGLKRGKNTIHILRAEGLRVAHLGDLGHMLSAGRLDALRGVDALMIPVGGYYTIDAATAKKLVDAIAPRVILPMHYRDGGRGYDIIAELADFTDLCDNIVRYDTNTLELTADIPAQAAVLRYAHG